MNKNLLIFDFVQQKVSTEYNVKEKTHFLINTVKSIPENFQPLILPLKSKIVRDMKPFFRK